MLHNSRNGLLIAIELVSKLVSESHPEGLVFTATVSTEPKLKCKVKNREIKAGKDRELIQRGGVRLATTMNDLVMWLSEL